MILTEIITRFLDMPLIDEPQEQTEEKTLPDQARQSLFNIQQRLEKLKDSDTRRFQAFVEAYEKILTYFWKMGYDKLDISSFFHELNEILHNHPHQSDVYVRNVEYRQR